MLDVELCFNNIEISNIQKEDLVCIQKWSESDDQFNFEQLYERFLESYLSECEYFLKIIKNKKLIGIIKGRVEFKNPNEAWIWFYYLDEIERANQLDCEIIKKIFECFSKEYDIKLFFTRVAVNDEIAIKFWKKIGFKPLRLVKDYYHIAGKNIDMMIMENGNIDKKLQNIL